MSKSTKNTPAASAPTVQMIEKVTPVPERKYIVSAAVTENESKFRGKQRQIVFDLLKASTEPMTIEELTPLAEEKGLKAIGGVEPSVRYHLHHLAKDGLVEVTNPKILIEVETASAAE